MIIYFSLKILTVGNQTEVEFLNVDQKWANTGPSLLKLWNPLRNLYSSIVQWVPRCCDVSKGHWCRMPGSLRASRKADLSCWEPTGEASLILGYKQMDTFPSAQIAGEAKGRAQLEHQEDCKSSPPLLWKYSDQSRVAKACQPCQLLGTIFFWLQWAPVPLATILEAPLL